MNKVNIILLMVFFLVACSNSNSRVERNPLFITNEDIHSLGLNLFPRDAKYLNVDDYVPSVINDPNVVSYQAEIFEERREQNNFHVLLVEFKTEELAEAYTKGANEWCLNHGGGMRNVGDDASIAGMWNSNGKNLALAPDFNFCPTTHGNLCSYFHYKNYFVSMLFYNHDPDMDVILRVTLLVPANALQYTKLVEMLSK